MKIAVFWHRRDLRFSDNAGLYHALKSGFAVLPLFIYDTDILEELEDRTDRRVQFIYQAINNLKTTLEGMGSSLLIRQGKPAEVMLQLAAQYKIAAVYTNHDYEPYATQRDAHIADLLTSRGIDFFTFKDQCIFEKSEVLKPGGTPYTVFTPYSKRWKAKLNAFFLSSYPTEKYAARLWQTPPLPGMELEEIGFQKTDIAFPLTQVDEQVLHRYKDRRDFPATGGTSRLSVHLRFGTVSVRYLARQAQATSETWLNELIWREFFMMILWHFPNVVTESFRKEYDRIEWRNNEKEFERWCRGLTGYPLVDAGMRELEATGLMHNRVRMVVASFLVKHLLIDWRRGEAFFACKLLDYELSSNNGNWQWAAGTGCDSAPYFRVFNPTAQAEKFDPDYHYIRKWLPEWKTAAYPLPIVNHEQARDRALRAYRKALGKLSAEDENQLRIDTN